MVGEKRVVLIGGGHGPQSIIKGLKYNPYLELSVILPVTDSSGSTGKWRDAYGTSGCTGDFVKSIAAFAGGELEKRLVHRLADGPNAGDTIGNLLFAAMQLSSTLPQAVKDMHTYCGIYRQRVIPVSDESATLVITTMNGKRVCHDGAIEKMSTSPLYDPADHAIKDIELVAQGSISQKAKSAIEGADEIIFCPGSLITSTVPILLMQGVPEAIRSSNGRTTFVVNLMTEKGMTQGYCVMDFVRRIEGLVDRKLDRIICNSGVIPVPVLEAYHAEHKEVVPLPPVINDRIIQAPIWIQDAQGRVVHDDAKIGKLLVELFSLETIRANA
jgi:uncharacterized cofD-like protein